MIQKSCPYCSGIHDRNYVCPMKPKPKYGKGYNRERTDIDRLRNTRKWKGKSKYIRIRDNYLCQLCIRELFNAPIKYNMHTLEVHHIVPIIESINRMYDDSNLITLCKYHHTLAEAGDINRALLHGIALEQIRLNTIDY